MMELYGVRPTPGLFVVDGKRRIRLNLYEVIFDDDSEYKALSHGKKAGRRAPYCSAWAFSLIAMLAPVCFELGFTQT